MVFPCVLATESGRRAEVQSPSQDPRVLPVIFHYVFFQILELDDEHEL